MPFSAFQTATETMEKIGTDGAGDETVLDSFEVKIDPVMGYKRITTRQNEEITGMTTVISPHESIDIEHENWRLGSRQIEQLVPFYTIGTTNIEHYEAVLR